MSEQDELERLERQLDAAFASTRPRRGFEDELWARLRSRRPIAGWSWLRAPGLAASGAVAVVLLAGVTVLTLVLFAGRGGHTGAGISTAAPGIRAQQPASLAPNGLPFGQLPAPPQAGVVQVVQADRLSPVPAGARMSIADGGLPQPGASLSVYRYDPASGPPAGAVLEPGALPATMAGSAYPTRQARDAFTEAAGRAAGAGDGAAANPSVQVPAATMTEARLVYVAVVAGGRGYLEPAYLFTGTYQNGGTAVAAQVLVPALAPSALRSG